MTDYQVWKDEMSVEAFREAMDELRTRRAADERREVDKEAYYARLGRAAEKQFMCENRLIFCKGEYGGKRCVPDDCAWQDFCRERSGNNAG